MKDRSRYTRVRCSRRFSPGSCLDPVRPVWTFVAPQQTCMERLGCPSSVFMNRYDSFEECTAMCRDLIYLYAYLQSLGNDTFKVPDEGIENSSRRPSVDDMYNEFIHQDKMGEDHNRDEDDDVESDADDDFRRVLHEAISALPLDPDAPEQTQPQFEGDDRPPPLSRRELMTDDPFDLPDIDRFGQ